MRSILSLVSTLSLAVASCFGQTYLDGPRVPLAPANAPPSAPWQWWYFDAVTNDGASFRIVFFSAYGFGAFVPTPYWAQFSTTFANGTRFTTIDVTTSFGNVSPSGGPYSNGDWKELGSWHSIPSGRHDIHFKSNSVDFSGTMTLTPNAPAAYPCGQNGTPRFDNAPKPNLLAPKLGWDVSIPGASAVVDFTLNGQRFKLSGTGYHDSNFGVVPIPDSSLRWVWARGQLGPYAFAAFAVLPKNYGKTMDPENPNTWYTSAYLSQNGKVLTNFCSNEQTIVDRVLKNLKFTLRGEVWNQGAACCQGDFPGNPVGVDVTFTFNGQRYSFSSDSQVQQLSGVPGVLPYANWVSKVKGGKTGEKYTGAGMFELLDYRS